jgi:hypothetical protein
MTHDYAQLMARAIVRYENGDSTVPQSDREPVDEKRSSRRQTGLSRIRFWYPRRSHFIRGRGLHYSGRNTRFLAILLANDLYHQLCLRCRINH